MAFEPSKRSRRNGTRAAQRLLGPDVVIREIGFGRAHARLTTSAIALVSIFVVAFIVALALGVVLIPGGLLLIVVLGLIRPPRAVVVTDHGTALLNRGIGTGRPTKVLALLAHDALPPPSALVSGIRAVPLGPDRVSFSRKEIERLTTAASLAGPQLRV